MIFKFKRWSAAAFFVCNIPGPWILTWWGRPPPTIVPGMRSGLVWSWFVGLWRLPLILWFLAVAVATTLGFEAVPVGLRQKYSSSSGSAASLGRLEPPPPFEVVETLLICCCWWLFEVLYFSLKMSIITKATSIKVTTTPTRIPRTGVNSSGTGLSAKSMKKYYYCPFLWMASNSYSADPDQTILKKSDCIFEEAMILRSAMRIAVSTSYEKMKRRQKRRKKNRDTIMLL